MKKIACAVVALCGLTQPGLAAPVGYLFAETTAYVAIDNQTKEDTGQLNMQDLSVSTASVEDEKSFTGFGPPDIVKGSAIQSDSGFSQVELSVEHDGERFAASGHMPQIETAAVASLVYQFGVGLAGPRDLGTFDFRVSGVELETMNAGGGPDAPTAEIRFSATVSYEYADGSFSIGPSYLARMALQGEYNNHTITTAENFSGSVTQLDCFFGVCQRGKVTVDTLTGSLDLGIAPQGAAVVLAVELAGNTTFNGTELGAFVKATDPNGVSYSVSGG